MNRTDKIRNRLLGLLARRKEEGAEGSPSDSGEEPSEGFQESYPVTGHREMADLMAEHGIKNTGEPMSIAFSLLKNTGHTVTYCSEKGCHAHAKRVAPEDGKAYCDVCVSNKMKEPKPEKPEDKAK